jgi:hypothetical protein
MQPNSSIPPETLITIPNAHVAPAPEIVPADGEYVAYFENTCGDQWLLIVSSDRTRGTLRGGDTGWAPTELRDDRLVGGPILGQDEFTWLSLCWRTATGRELTPPLWQRIKQLLTAASDEEGEA